MNITLDRLKYFMEVAKLEHVGLASKSLGISASAISSAITLLEEECQCDLFDRTNKRIHLNEHGKLFRERVEPILEQVEQLASELTAKQTVFRGFLSVGGSHFLGIHYLQPVLNQIQINHPALRTENSPQRTTQVIQDVLGGLMDYGVCFSPHGHPQLESNLLYTGELQLVVSKSHPLVKASKRADFKLSELNRYPAVIHKFAPGVDYCENHPAFGPAGIKPNITQYFHSDDLCVQSVIGSEAWSLIPDVVTSKYAKDLFVLAVPRGWKTPYEICSVYRRSLKNKRIFHFLNEQLKDMLLQKQ